MRRGAAAGLALIALAACDREAPRAVTPDIGNAASEAQADIDNYAAGAGNGVTIAPEGAMRDAPPANDATLANGAIR